MGLAYNPKTVTDGLVLYVDAGNPKSYSTNVHPNPTDIFAWVNSTSGSSSTLSRDTTTVSPVGETPLRMIQTGNDAHTSTYNTSIWNLAPAVQGETWTVSVWVKASAVTTIEGILLFEANSAGAFTTLSAGPTTTLSTNWQRIQLTRTFNQSTTAFVQVRLEGTQTGGAGITLWWDGLQVEKSAAPTTFNSKTNVNGIAWTDLTGVNANGSVVGALTYATNPARFETNVVNVTTRNQLNTASQLELLDGSTYTFDFYVKLRSGAQVTYHTLAGRSSTNPWLSIEPSDTAGTTFRVSYRASGGTFFPTNYISYNLQNNWGNIVLTVDSSRNVRVYLNGQFQQTINPTSTLFYVSNLAGGYSSGGNFYNLQGALGAAKIYNRTLTAQEVNDNFNASKGRYGL
jgi:hypothetical protein